MESFFSLIEICLSEINKKRVFAVFFSLSKVSNNKSTVYFILEFAVVNRIIDSKVVFSNFILLGSQYLKFF